MCAYGMCAMGVRVGSAGVCPCSHPPGLQQALREGAGLARSQEPVCGRGATAPPAGGFCQGPGAVYAGEARPAWLTHPP